MSPPVFFIFFKPRVHFVIVYVGVVHVYVCVSVYLCVHVTPRCGHRLFRLPPAVHTRRLAGRRAVRSVPIGGPFSGLIVFLVSACPVCVFKRTCACCLF